VPRARGAAQRLIEEANGYRQRVVANAEGETARFRSVLFEYARAPQITRERLYIETLQQILTSSTKIIVDARSSGNMLFLPLDRIMSMAGSSASGRSRDSLRARDRESRP
jgi:membrane protease subunit HflK